MFWLSGKCRAGRGDGAPALEMLWTVMKSSSETSDFPAGQDGSSIGPLDSLPVFFRAAGRRMIVIGGSDGAAWKVELLAAAAAQVEVFAPAPSERLMQFLVSRPAIVLHRRPWAEADLAGALAIVAEAADDEDARAIRDAARRAGVPVNIVDRPAFCDFQFGSIVNRSPVVIGISTGGAAPVFGQALRARIETLLPRGFAAWAQAARRWREDLARAELPFRARRKFWEKFSAAAFSRPGEPPDDVERDALLAAAGADDAAPARGKALLVGAGPGDPELMTLRAVRAIQSADVILYDDLASPAILEMARREAEKIDVGKRAARPSPTQQDVTTRLVELVASGKNVVRLKGGDPMIFGRANEEIAALKAAGLDVEIVPGVTTASAAARAPGPTKAARCIYPKSSSVRISATPRSSRRFVRR